MSASTVIRAARWASCSGTSKRYGSLHIPGDSFSYDIFTHGARSVCPSRSTVGGDPMRGLEVKRVIATGGSQSASRLATYLNAVHAREQIFDAVLLFTYFGFLSSIDSDTTLDLADPDTSRAFHHSDSGVLLRTDLDIPVMVVNSECETLPHFPARQPDSECYRFWEVAGTSHATVPDMGPIIAKIVRDGVALPTPEGLGAMPPMNSVSWHPVLAAALAHLQRWTTAGEAPPSMPRITVTGEPPQIERDELGIALGGIRLPQVEVPTAAHSGENGLEGPGSLYGASVPFDEATMLRLYPDHDQYIVAVTAAAQRAHDEGVLLARYATEAVEAAKSTPLPA